MKVMTLRPLQPPGQPGHLAATPATDGDPSYSEQWRTNSVRLLQQPPNTRRHHRDRTGAMAHCTPPPRHAVFTRTTRARTTACQANVHPSLFGITVGTSCSSQSHASMQPQLPPSHRPTASQLLGLCSSHPYRLNQICSMIVSSEC